MLSSGGGKPGGSFPTALSMLATFTSFQTAWYILYIALSPFSILCLPDGWAVVGLQRIQVHLYIHRLIPKFTHHQVQLMLGVPLELYYGSARV